MVKLALRPIRLTDLACFLRWWNDPILRKLTSNATGVITPRTIARRVVEMINPLHDLHRMILLRGKPIGHIALIRRRGLWYELQIVIGEKRYWNQGFGSGAVQTLLSAAKRNGWKKIYLEVLPSNRRARYAFARCGFLPVRGIRRWPARSVPTVRMEYSHPAA